MLAPNTMVQAPLARVPVDGVEHKGSTDSAWDFFSCKESRLRNITRAQLDSDVGEAGFTIVRNWWGRRKSEFHRFDSGGCGFSYVAIIMESHIAIHFSPENPMGFELTIHTCKVDGTGVMISAEEKKENLYTLWRGLFEPQDVLAFEPRDRANLRRLRCMQGYETLAGYAPRSRS